MDSDAISLAAHDALTALAQLGILKQLGDETITRIITHICTKIVEHLKEGKTIRVDIINNLFYTVQELVSDIPESTLFKVNVIDAIMDAIALGISDDVAKRVVSGLILFI